MQLIGVLLASIMLAMICLEQVAHGTPVAQRNGLLEADCASLDWKALECRTCCKFIGMQSDLKAGKTSGSCACKQRNPTSI